MKARIGEGLRCSLVAIVKKRFDLSLPPYLLWMLTKLNDDES